MFNQFSTDTLAYEIETLAAKKQQTIRERQPSVDIAKKYKITEDVPLITTVTLYYDKQKKPFAVRTHTIPQTPPIII